MDDLEARFAAIELLLARVIETVARPGELARELDETLPTLGYATHPDEDGRLPHIERILETAAHFRQLRDNLSKEA